jgi:1,4-alpha-glucan branching enzyme
LAKTPLLLLPATDERIDTNQSKEIGNLRVARGSVRVDGRVTMNAIVTKQRQIFSLNAPDAHNVLLAGDFTRWLKRPIPLHRETNGVWRTTTLLAPGTYHYRFLVDGEWRDDPECKLRVQNPFGTQNDVIQVPEKPGPRIAKSRDDAGHGMQRLS